MRICKISYSKTFSDTRVVKYIKHYLNEGHSVFCHGLDDPKNNFINNNAFNYEQINSKFSINKSKNLLQSLILLTLVPFALVRSVFFSLFSKKDKKKEFILKDFLSLINSFKKYLTTSNNIIGDLINKEYDIIHVHDLWLITAAVQLKKNFPHAKLIIDLHELYSELPNQTFFKKTIPLAFIFYIKFHKNKIYKIITINEEIKNYYLQEFKLPSLVINNSCDDDRIKTSFHLDKVPASLIKLKQEGKKILIYQGGLSPYRGIEEMCDFFITSPPENWVFLIMGDGNLKTNIHNFVLKSNKIFLIPAVSLSELVSYTNFAHLGLINYENICLNHNFCNPNKLWEYSKSKLPMLLSNCQSFINLNKKYSFAKIIDSKNISQLSEIFKILDDQELSIMSKNSKLFYDSNNWENEKTKINTEILSIK
jgi:glycosyltransferase involved in cell wall biosynthesis